MKKAEQLTDDELCWLWAYNTLSDLAMEPMLLNAKQTCHEKRNWQ